MARFTSLDDAFKALADIDPSAVDDARDIVAGITGHQGIDDPSVLTLADMLRWLWLRLPTQPGLDPSARATVLAHAATFFDTLGRPSWSARCRSDATRKIHAAWDVSPSKGKAAFRRAFASSGVEPPSIPGFTWSDYLGPDELRANELVELVLEMALNSGHIQPGRRGWHDEARRATEAVLHSEVAGGFGQRWIDLIITERLGFWVEHAAAPSLARLRSAVVNRLLHPVPVPPDAAEVLRPLVWFVAHLGDTGVKLSSRGYLERRFVEAAADELGWRLPGRAVRSEADVSPLSAVRALAIDCDLAAVHNGRLVVRDWSRYLLDHDHIDELWDTVVAQFSYQTTFSDVALETVLLVLLAEGELPTWRHVATAAAAVLADVGWNSARTAAPCTEDDVMAATHERRRLLDVLGAFDYGDIFTGGVELSDIGRAIALTVLRSHAAAPRRSTEVL